MTAQSHPRYCNIGCKTNSIYILDSENWHLQAMVDFLIIFTLAKLEGNSRLQGSDYELN